MSRIKRNLPSKRARARADVTSTSPLRRSDTLHDLLLETNVSARRRAASPIMLDKNPYSAPESCSVIPLPVFFSFSSFLVIPTATHRCAFSSTYAGRLLPVTVARGRNVDIASSLESK